MTDPKILSNIGEWLEHWSGPIETSPRKTTAVGHLRRIADRLEGLETEAAALLTHWRHYHGGCACLPDKDYVCISCSMEKVLADAPKGDPVYVPFQEPGNEIADFTPSG